MTKKSLTSIMWRGTSVYIRLPAIILRDSKFPFRINDKLVMEIRGKKDIHITVRRAGGKQLNTKVSKAIKHKKRK